MTQALELPLHSGATLRWELPDPAGEGGFAFALEPAGGAAFRALVVALCRAAGRTTIDLDSEWAAAGARPADLAPSAWRALAAVRGVVVTAAGPELWPQLRHEPAQRRVVFLRDPRDLAATTFVRPEGRDGQTVSDYLEGAEFGAMLDAYRVFLADRRAGRDLVLRYEPALDGWRETAAELVAFLDLPLAPRQARDIADGAPPLWAGWRDMHHRDAVLRALIALNGCDARVQAKLEFALEALGCPDVPALWRRERAGPMEASLRPPPGLALEKTGEPPSPRVSQPDPVLYHRLRPNARMEREVAGRRILLETDAFGCRLVVGQPETGEKTVAIYGCSFTFGTTSAAQETFCSRLQGMLPRWRIENHGVAGYSQSRNLIALERESRFNPAEFVAFTWIRDHLRRNAADIGWVQATSGGMVEGAGAQLRVATIPRASLDAKGELSLTAIRYPRDDLGGVEVGEFEPSPYYLNQVCFKLFERAARIVKGYGGTFFVVDLQGVMSPVLAEMLRAAEIPLVKTLKRGPEHFVTPTDPHPNALAHQIYAQKIYEHLAALT